ncbi:hypothetical protein L1049_016821 [Liquidambar formosana]|uniref:Uncharacterized protein n=1 Tax=Liquidambar formosana TaxID=63359 RepID=A0AAP0X728_LIQFO
MRLTAGFPRPTKWFSSSSNGKNEKSSCPKKSEAAREQKAVAVESVVFQSAAADLVVCQLR